MLAPLLLALLTATPEPSIGVMDFAPQGASADLAAAVSSVTAHELERLRVFRVISAETTRVVLGVERQRALLGADDSGGVTLTDLVTFDYIVSGKVVKTGAKGGAASYSVVMTLIDRASSRPLSTMRAEGATEAGLLQEVGPAAVKLLGKVLESRQGALVVSSTEVGASVKVDDTQVGTTPLPGKLPLGAGPHLVSVEKDGFSAVRKEVRIAPDAVSEESFRLVPSPDTIAAYEAGARRTRILAWVATCSAAVGAGAFAFGQVQAGSLFGSVNDPNSFAFHQSQLYQGVEVSPDGVNHRTQAGAKKAQIETMQLVSYVGLGVAGAGAATAVVLWVTGDDPAKYELYRDTKVSLGLTPSPSGVVLSGTFD